MNLRNSTMVNNWQKVISISILFFVFSNSLAFSQTSSAPISFTKKEIGFYKWGVGSDEVGLQKNESDNIYHGMNLGGKKYTYHWPRILKIDGNDNVYFLDSFNKKIFIISADGGLIKTIGMEKTGGFVLADEEGNVYGLNLEEGKGSGFILTKPDGTREVFKNFNFSYEKNGIVYDLKNNKALTITDNGDKPEKLPPQNLDVEKKDRDSFVIDTKKINEHLRKINRRIDSDKVVIRIEKKLVGKFHVRPLTNLIGVDDNGNFFFFCRYSVGPGIEDPYEEADVMVYSQTGQKISEIPISLDSFNKQTSQNEIQLDIRGDVFQMWANEDGMHILKWTKH